MVRNRGGIRETTLERINSHAVARSICLVRLPGHPADPKARPALIVSMDVRNRLANDVIVVSVSTTQRPAPTHVRLPAGEGGRGPFAGAINPALMQEVEKAIQRAIGIFLP